MQSRNQSLNDVFPYRVFSSFSDLKFVQSCPFKFDKASFFCSIIHHTSAEMVFLLRAELNTLKMQLISLLSSLFRTTEEAPVKTSTEHFSSCFSTSATFKSSQKKPRLLPLYDGHKSSFHPPNTLPEINIEGGAFDVHHKNQHPGHKPTATYSHLQAS